MTSNHTSGKAGSINRLSLNECDGDVLMMVVLVGMMVVVGDNRVTLSANTNTSSVALCANPVVGSCHILINSYKNSRN